MTTAIFSSKPRPIDFTFEGSKLAVRKLPLSLGLKLQALEGDNIPAELLGEIIAKCVVTEEGTAVFSAQQVLDSDLEPMLKLFNEVTSGSLDGEDVEKNSVASLR